MKPAIKLFNVMRIINWKIQIKGWVSLILLFAWSFVLATGIIMYLAPHGQGMGSKAFLLGLSRHEWGEFHWWLAVAAVVFTIIHVIVDWKPFTGLLKHMFAK